MKKKFSKAERIIIVFEAQKAKNKSDVSVKYDIHLSTLYRWISHFERKSNKNKHESISFKVSTEQKKMILSKCKALGYEKDISSCIRKVLFSKHIAIGNPSDIVKELYVTRGELNKIGSNLNQIANYTNFLKNQNYVDDSYIKDLEKLLTDYLTASKGHRIILDKTIKKI